MINISRTLYVTDIAVILALMTGCSPVPDEYVRQREQMVQTQIVSRGVSDEGTLQAMRRVPRHRFVPVD